MEASSHFADMLAERGIAAAWVHRALREPDKLEKHADGTRHYLKRIPEHGGSWLRVIVNEDKRPPVKVTAFFDRRLRRPSYAHQD